VTEVRRYASAGRPTTSAHTGSRPSQLRGVRLALDIDGLLQRFGRPAPEGIALLGELSRIRQRASAGGSERRLEVCVIRHASQRGGETRARLVDDLRSLDLLSDTATLGGEPLLVTNAAELAALAHDSSGRMGVMLMGGRHRPVSEALKAGLPAYVLSDRRVAGVEQLAFAEAGRVIAESLRLPTPRPISDLARRGVLLALDIADVPDARQVARSAMREDPRADWIVIANMMLLYTESDELVDDLVSRGAARRLPRTVNKLELALAPDADRQRIEPMLSVDGHAIGRARDGDPAPPIMSWSNARRRVIGTPRNGQPTRDLPARPHHGSVLESGFVVPTASDLVDSTPEALFEVLRTLLPASAALDIAVSPLERPLIMFSSPHRTDASEDLIAISYQSTESMPEGNGLIQAHHARAALTVAARLAEGRGTAGTLHCLHSAASPSLDRLLWQGEANRVVAVIRLADSGTPETTVAATSTLVGPLERVIGPVAPLDGANARLPTVSIRGPVAAPSGLDRAAELCAEAVRALTR
jgi:hypothetical protein